MKGDMENEKGFSIKKTVVIIVIIILILLLAILIFTNVFKGNSTKQYEKYLEVVKSGALRYAETDEAKGDLGGHADVGCTEVTLEKLIEKKYIKKYTDKKITCTGTARLNNDKGKTSVSVDLSCTNKKGEVTYKVEQIDDSTCLSYIYGSNDPNTSVSLTNKILMSNMIYPDNISSPFVSSDTGIDFNKPSSNTNGKGLYYSTNTENSQRTYYYRGDVNNNYVKLGKDSSGNDIYWRIIRINEDGSVRLIYQGTKATGGDTTIGSSSFNEAKDDNACVGYYFGKNGVNTYLNTHANENKSDIYKLLEEWYTKNSFQNFDNIADTGFCNDRGLASGYGYSDIATKYNANARFEGGKVTPTFKCSGSNDLFTTNSNNGNGALGYPVGLITMDEIVYAGGEVSYLHNNNKYWTMTPSDYSSAGSKVYSVNKEGSIVSATTNNSYGVRPVINVKACAIWEGGTGTANSPYEISSCLTELSTYMVAIESNSLTSGTVTPVGKAVHYDGTATFTLAPKQGYYYSSNTCGGVVEDDILTISNITSNLKCTVTFIADEYKVNVSSNNTNYGTVSPASKTVDHGGSVEITLVPKKGYKYGSNTCGGTVVDNVMTISNVTSEKTCTVTFVNAVHSVKVSSNNTNYGTVNPTSTTVSSGDDVEIAVTAKSGYYYSNNNCGGTVSGGKLIIKNVTSDITCTVNFARSSQSSSYNVSVSSNNTNYGTVSQSSTKVNYGGSITVTLTPKSGYKYVSNTCGGTVSGNKMTISNITTNKTCTVNFASASYKITVSSNNTNYGTVSPATIDVSHGSSAVILLSPKSGYKYGSNNCGATVSGNTMTLKNITSDKTCVVTFVSSEAPTTPTITRKDYNTFSYSATDNTGVAGYYISKDSTTKPSATASGWTTSTSYDINGAGTYRVWAKDKDGNVSASAGTITAHTVTRSQGAGSTLTTRYDSTSSSSGTAFSSNTLVVLNGTNIWAQATANTNYENPVLTRGGSKVTNPSSAQVTGNVTIASSATAKQTEYYWYRYNAVCENYSGQTLSYGTKKTYSQIGSGYTHKGYTGYTFNEKTGKFTFIGEYHNLGCGAAEDEPGWITTLYDGTQGGSSMTIYECPLGEGESITYGYDYSHQTVTVSGGTCTSYGPSGSATTVTSTNRNAYPDNGVSGSYYYVYQGNR